MPDHIRPARGAGDRPCVTILNVYTAVVTSRLNNCKCGISGKFLRIHTVAPLTLLRCSSLMMAPSRAVSLARPADHCFRRRRIAIFGVDCDDADHPGFADRHQARDHVGADDPGRRGHDLLADTGGADVDGNRQGRHAAGDRPERRRGKGLGPRHADRHSRHPAGDHPAELKKADDYFADRTTAALKFTGEMARLSQSAENRQRDATEQKVLIEGLRNGKDSSRPAPARKLTVEAKNADHSAEATAQMAKLVRVKSSASARK